MTALATRAGSKRTTITWQQSDDLVPYPDALAAMDSRVEAIHKGEDGELGWLLEHPPLYTGGTSAKTDDLLVPDRFPVYETGRGGQYTYHGPGQRVVYLMLDLRRRGQDLRRYVWQLEEWIIETLKPFEIAGERREGRIGIWVIQAERPGSQDRGDRCSRAPLGHVPRHRRQPRSRSQSLQLDRALRPSRIWRDLDHRSRQADDYG